MTNQILLKMLDSVNVNPVKYLISDQKKLSISLFFSVLPNYSECFKMKSEFFLTIRISAELGLSLSSAPWL